MKKVVIFGAAGHTGKYLTRKMPQEPDVQLSVFVRNPGKFGDMDLGDTHILQGDALTREGEKPACWTVDRAAIAQCMADIVRNETLGANESLGITNGYPRLIRANTVFRG